MFENFSRQDFTVGWGTLALINAGLAQTKNRSAANWLSISLFIGSIATALLVLLPKFEPTEEQVERSKQRWERFSKVILVALIILILLIMGAVVYFRVGR